MRNDPRACGKSALGALGSKILYRDRLTGRTSDFGSEDCRFESYSRYQWFITGSANGRPLDSDSGYLGSNPSPVTNLTIMPNSDTIDQEASHENTDLDRCTSSNGRGPG